MASGLYALPPGAQFAEAFAAGLLARLGDGPPEAAADVTVLVSTRRAGRMIEDALAAAAGGAALLPRITLLSELGQDPLADLPPAVDPMRRLLHLTRLVAGYLEASGGPVAAAPELAVSLAGLLDELQEEGVDPARLDHAVPGEMAEHWQRSLDFADLVRRVWPGIRQEAEGAALDPKARQRAVIEGLAARWRKAPPPGPVIAAGSTGSVASTAELLAAIARLPRGAVVLPGFDPALPDEVWDCLGRSPDHPMAPFTRLLGLLDARPAEVRPWGKPAPSTPRLRLLAQALRPAPVTDAWIAAAPALAAEAAAASAGLTLIEAQGPREEAGAIALAIRRGLEDPARRIALVTPDATLARRVTAELARFGVTPDDSLGRPLAQSPAGVFLRLVLRLAEPGAGPVEIAALLGHPLMRPGMARGRHRGIARAYETVLRARPEPGRAAGSLPAWSGATGQQAAWRDAIEAALRPLAAALSGGTLAGIVAAHVAAVEALSRQGPETDPAVWEGDDGAMLRRLLARIAAAADAHGGPVPGWSGLLAVLMQGEQLRPAPERPHPRVAIWGTMEARTGAADLVILGGLNEGVWPPVPAADPWLSRPMRETLGLGPPERAIGLSAHDFLQAAAKPTVILSRATRVEGAPTVAARWLLRLENLMGGLGEGSGEGSGEGLGDGPEQGAALAAMRARGAALVALTRLVHTPEAAVPPAPRPAPCPPASARPHRLSATEIERLIRDAYAVYAKRVLKLKPLDPLGRPADYRDRGIVIHEILQRFVDRTPELPPDPEAKALLLRIAEDTLAERVPWPDTRRVWLGRVARFADWFVEGEHERRQAGHPVLTEALGTMALEIAGADFEVVAKADRIDLLDDGAAAIFDYKSGAPPSAKTIGVFAHQLHIQAAILMAGGFEGLAPVETRIGVYLGLTGSAAGGKAEGAKDLPDGVAQHRAWLAELLAAYMQAPYLSRGRVETLEQEGDYDHLARRWEWEGA